MKNEAVVQGLEYLSNWADDMAACEAESQEEREKARKADYEVSVVLEAVKKIGVKAILEQLNDAACLMSDMSEMSEDRKAALDFANRLRLTMSGLQ